MSGGANVAIGIPYYVITNITKLAFFGNLYRHLASNHTSQNKFTFTASAGLRRQILVDNSGTVPPVYSPH